MRRSSTKPPRVQAEARFQDEPPTERQESPGAGKAPGRARENEMTTTPRIAARPLEDDGSGRLLFIPIPQVAYLFRGVAVSSGLILAAWGPRPQLAPSRIYIRTLKGGLFVAVDRSLASIAGRYRDSIFAVHESILANLDAVHDAFLRGAGPQIGVRVGSGIEYLPVAKRRLAGLRERLLGPEFPE